MTTQIPFQGGLDNNGLREAFEAKLPGAAPTDRDLTVFALGVEVGVGIGATRYREPVSWQVRRTDGSPLATWETCTHELYEATLATGRYSGYENGPPCEVRALVSASEEPTSAAGVSEQDLRRALLSAQKAFVRLAQLHGWRRTPFEPGGDDWVSAETQGLDALAQVKAVLGTDPTQTLHKAST